MALKYDESSIKILEGLEAVRKRPGMYIGSTDKRGLHHLIWEIVDNSIDEVINGFGDYISVTLHEDGSCSVSDKGRGLPTGMHASGKSTPEVIFTVLHAGGKFETSGYKVSGGLHGVGASVVNALSSWLEVTIARDGYEYYIRFEDGGKVKTPLKKLGKTNKHGTTVRFMPDYSIFKGASFSYTTVRERMQESAFLIKGLTVELFDIEDNKHDKLDFLSPENSKDLSFISSLFLSIVLSSHIIISSFKLFLPNKFLSEKDLFISSFLSLLFSFS